MNGNNVSKQERLDYRNQVINNIVKLIKRIALERKKMQLN